MKFKKITKTEKSVKIKCVSGLWRSLLHGDKKLAKAIAEQTGADYLIYIDGYFQKEKVRNAN